MKSVLEFFDTLRWIFIIAWRHANGRWFILRDAPDHFLIKISTWKCDPEKDEEYIHLPREATQELRRRWVKEL